MKTIEIHGQTGGSKIVIGESLENLEKYTTGTKRVIVTDENLDRLYRHQFPPWAVIEIGTGEKIKTLETVVYIFKKLLELEIDRSCFIVGIGGGIVCDITGFVASTYMRGLPFGFVSTSLLSQVDASAGGKNGVNFDGYKNMIGVFNQPLFVICDPGMLKTLPHKELLSGFAEIVKHAAIGSAELFIFLEKNFSKALALDGETLEKLVYDSVTIKAKVVDKDEKEKGERRILNFGHTLGHALEKTSGLSHGEAVSVGMVFAAELSVIRKGLSKVAAERIRGLLSQIGLPTVLPVDKEKIVDALKRDKKREGDGIHFILLEAIGHAVSEVIPFEELEMVIHDLC
ncbi:MAG TPA: 3-dehydroquinate synthase [Candidatus Kapabacteria bacterium]|nr:3-dehydroquinate synthase [Candidatus Kapabacteria bacterium]